VLQAAKSKSDARLNVRRFENDIAALEYVALSALETTPRIGRPRAPFQCGPAPLRIAASSPEVGSAMYT
jgi:hypothetical protein